MSTEDSSTIPQKRCKRCGNSYPRTAAYFYRDNSQRHGLQHTCKKCQSARRRKEYPAHADKERKGCREYGRKRRITHGDEVRAKDRRRYYTHHQKILARNRRWKQTHQKERRAYSRKYYVMHPERFREAQKKRDARKRGAHIIDFTETQWQEMQAAYGYRCVYCPPNCWRCQRRKHKLTRDHITPLTKGGNHTLSNILPACQRCNARKYTGPPPIPVQPLLL